RMVTRIPCFCPALHVFGGREVTLDRRTMLAGRRGPRGDSMSPKSVLIAATALLTASALLAPGVRADTCASPKTVGLVANLPYRINVSGCYVLKANLIVPDANTTAIKVNVPNVTIDLNNHEVSGPNTCPGAVCTASGTGIGIDAANRKDVIVMNGT